MKNSKKSWTFTAKQKRKDTIRWKSLDQEDRWYRNRNNVFETDRIIRQLNRLGCNALTDYYQTNDYIFGTTIEDIYFPNGKKRRFPLYY